MQSLGWDLAVPALHHKKWLENQFCEVCIAQECREGEILGRQQQKSNCTFICQSQKIKGGHIIPLGWHKIGFNFPLVSHFSTPHFVCHQVRGKMEDKGRTKASPYLLREKILACFQIRPTCLKSQPITWKDCFPLHREKWSTWKISACSMKNCWL